MSTDYPAARAAAGIPAAGRLLHWFDSGWCAAAHREVALRPGSDHARVRYALRQFGPERDSRSCRAVFAKGVRAKLAHYRALGLLDPDADMPR